MLSERFVAVLLILPLLAILYVSISYWIVNRNDEKKASSRQHIGYNKVFLTMVGLGYFSIWPFWLGGIVFMFLGQYYTRTGFLVCPPLMALPLQILGLVVLYIGALFFAWAVGHAGRSLRPSTSGVLVNHKLVQDGPLGIVRHPYYVSYVLMLVGLGMTLATFWPLLPALCVVVGMGPTARAEEEYLTGVFGKAYEQYQQRVGRFFPKIHRS